MELNNIPESSIILLLKLDQFSGSRPKAAPKANKEEAVKFVRWVKNSPVTDAAETFRLLHATLKLTGGDVSGGRSVFDFVRGVCEIRDGHELMALRCLNKAMNDEYMGEDFGIYEDELTAFMNAIVKLKDDYAEVDKIRKEAMSLADAYGRMHIYSFKPVYEELKKRVEAGG